MTLTLHIFHQNKKDHSDTANLPTAGPDWIDLRLQKGCLESRIMLRLDEALIAGVPWKTAEAPATHDLMFCQLSATSEAVENPWAQVLPVTAMQTGCSPPLHVRLGMTDIFQGCQWGKGATAQPHQQSWQWVQLGRRVQEIWNWLQTVGPASCGWNGGDQKGPQCHPVTAGMLLQQAKAHQ